MGSTLKAERNQVRFRLNDLNIGNAILQSDLVDAAIQDVYGLMVNDGLSDSSWDAVFVTLDDGVSQYLGGTDEYARIQAVRFDTGPAVDQFLIRTDPISIRERIGSSQQTGLPIYYALDPSGGPTDLWVSPTPGTSEAGVRLSLHSDSGVGALVLDTDQIGLSRTGLSALRELAAAKIAKKLGPKMLEKLDLLPDTWQDMKAEGERLLYSERLRVARQLRGIALRQVMA